MATSKTELIRAILATFRASHRRDEYVDVIEAELHNRLPDEKILTCDDLRPAEVACCDTCHTLYPHYEMQASRTSDGTAAWLCCSVTAALKVSAECA